MCGYTSRRKADELIEKGVVFVNDKPVKEPGLSVDTQNDRVRIGDEELFFEKKRYIMLNKPKLYLTTLENNEDDKRTIMELISDLHERVYPVGRLDFDAEGLLFLTNDGELAHKLHHPSYAVPKEYLCVLNKKIGKVDMEHLQNGASLEDGFAKPDSVRLPKSTQSGNVVVITFHEGKNHLVKRYFNNFGFKVIKLKRVSVGPLNLGDLKKGQWRDLTKKEMQALFNYLK